MVFQFERDDVAYLRWLEEHPGGYVLNSNYSFSPRLTVIHSATCATIKKASATGRRDGGFTERGYVKVFADGIDALQEWMANKRTDVTARICGICLRIGGGKPLSFEHRFQIGATYKKADIYSLCDVPVDCQRGAWDTGYIRYGASFFVFCNIGAPGRTGHDYANHFIGDELLWYPRPSAHPDQPLMRDMLDPSTPVLVFYRDDDREPFVFHGRGRVARQESDPFRIVWAFHEAGVRRMEVLPEEVTDGSDTFAEGAVKSVRVDARERNPAARAACLRHYGRACSVCGLNFQNIYGEIGADYIHVHHLVPLAACSDVRQVDPVRDLRPVCANCHAMLHRQEPPYTIEELREHMAAAAFGRE